MLTFDVPGAVTWSHVHRSRPSETWAEALHRLAAKAVISGCQVFDVNEDQTACRVTSATVAGRSYRVAIEPVKRAAVCRCVAHEVNAICAHSALAVATLVGLPDLAVEPLVAKFAGKCCRTGETYEAGALITRSARGGWMLVTHRNKGEQAA